MDTALVTGASSGIGEALARELAGRGWGLVLTARSREALERLAEELTRDHGVDTHVVTADLAVPGGADTLADALADAGLHIDLLVNNAGFGQWGFYPELDGDDETAMLRLNVEALTRLTRRLLPPMLQRRGGWVLNVASLGAFLPGPWMAGYFASKAYVLSYSEALAEELKDTGVTVSCLCPGPVRTGFQERAGFRISSASRLGEMDARTVAQRGLDGLFRGRPVVVPGLVNRITAALPRFLPRRLVTKMVGRVQSGRAGDPGAGDGGT